jgi:mono/diheme cytochrome c family protein
MKTILLAALALATPVSGKPLKIELPADVPMLKDAPGREVLLAQCLLCHSLDYISSQPPMSAESWKKIVQKMQKTFGAPLPDAQVDAVVAYLATNYAPLSNAVPAKK